MQKNTKNPNKPKKLEKNSPYSNKSPQRNKEIANIYQNKSDLKRLKESTTKPINDLTRKLKSTSRVAKTDPRKLNMYRSEEYLTQSEKLNMINSKDLKDALDEDYGVFSESIKKSLKDWLFKNPRNLTTEEDFITKIVQNTKKAEKTVEKKVEKIVGNLVYKTINDDDDKIIKKLLAGNRFDPNEYQSDKFEDNLLGLFGEVGSKIFLAKLAEKRKKPISSNESVSDSCTSFERVSNKTDTSYSNDLFESSTNTFTNKPPSLVSLSGSKVLNRYSLQLGSCNKSRNNG